MSDSDKKFVLTIGGNECKPALKSDIEKDFDGKAVTAKLTVSVMASSELISQMESLKEKESAK